MECNVCFHARLEAECERIIAALTLPGKCGYIPSLLSKQTFFMQMMLQLAMCSASVCVMEIPSTIQVPSRVTRFQRTTVKIRILGRDHSDIELTSFFQLLGKNKTSVSQLVHTAILFLTDYVWIFLFSWV